MTLAAYHLFLQLLESGELLSVIADMSPVVGLKAVPLTMQPDFLIDAMGGGSNPGQLRTLPLCHAVACQNEGFFYLSSHLDYVCSIDGMASIIIFTLWRC